MPSAVRTAKKKESFTQGQLTPPKSGVYHINVNSTFRYLQNSKWKK